MRSNLRISDLGRRGRTVRKLMNLQIPTQVSDAIHRVAKAMGASKTDVVIALLNEGLDRSAQLLRGWKPVKVPMPRPTRVCSVRGCNRPYVAKGKCASHYQAARRATRSSGGPLGRGAHA